ncbi:hypothetical protein [Lactococcus petauri]|uniref:hypothetical protein n=1 Tax=Lactococcus petauri TaxID=1940789 RepID=UPI00254F4DE9|nr:hypothetical protein [Lactococcus petauri]
MKKYLAMGIITLGALGLLGNTVQADDSTEVEYEVGSDYVISIPSKVTLDAGGTVPLIINSVSHNLSPTKTVSVSLTDGLSDAGEIELKRFVDPTTTINGYVTLNGSALPVNNTLRIYDYTAEQTEELARLEIGLLGNTNSFKAGTYSTTLTFTSEMADKNIS